MSVASSTLRSRSGTDAPRVLALLGVALLALAHLSTLYWVTGIRGGRRWLLSGLVIALLVAVLVHRREERQIFVFATVVLVVSGVWYAATVRSAPGAAAAWQMAVDTAAMLTGITVLQMAAVDVWIAATVPASVFLSAYFALRRRYVYAALSSGWLVCFLTLTGDATAIETLAGTIGAVATVGFGEIDRRSGTLAGADVLIVVVALMAVFGAFVPIVPSGEASTITPAGGADTGPNAGGGAGGAAGTPSESASLDDELLSSGPVQPSGPLELSSDVRFVVESEEHRRWRVGVLDQYDGQGWRQNPGDRPYNGPMLGPPGETRTVEQTVEFRAPSDGSLPHAATPTAVGEDVAPITRVTRGGALRAEQPLEPGTTYTVRSEVPDAGPEELAAAGSDYPPAVRAQYTDLSVDVPSRVENLSAQVTSDADSDYEAAVAIDAYLQDTKEYSLNVSPPTETTLVDGFLFEMDAGYCTYFAASMATMLRTQDVPARVAVGYNAGQWVDENTSVVRGTDAHAWVEVYYPGVGWVEHDPTPSSDWQDQHADAVEDARASGADGVDVAESANESVRYQPPEGDAENGTSAREPVEADDGNGQINQTPRRDVTGRGDGSEPYVDPDEGLAPDSENGSEADERDSNDSVVDGTPASAATTRLLGGFEDLLLGVLVLGGTVAGARRVGLAAALGPSTGVLWQRRRDPVTDAEVAIDRLEYWLGDRYGSRRPGETPREYLDRLPRSVDDRVRRAYELHEQVRYAGDGDRALADELVGIVDGLTRRSLPIVGRLWS